MCKGCTRGFGTTLAIDGGTDDTTGIACTLATGIKASEANMTQELRVTHDANGSRRAGLNADYRGLTRKETMTLAVEGREAFLQAAAYEFGHPEVKG